MTKHLIRLALVAGVVAAPFTAPAAHAAVPPLCQTDVELSRCVADLLQADSDDFCIPTGDLEDDCHWG